MTPAALYFASGDSFHFGAFLLLLAIVASPHLKHRWMLLSRNVTSWIALAMMVMACPPFFWGVDLILLAAFFVWFIASNTAKPSEMWLRLRLSAATALLISLLTLSALELSHRTMPVITGVASDHLAVIGDSISSGIDSRSPAWPAVMQQMTGIPVKNLARPGAGVAEGRAMAESITPEDRIVLIEIGGNDLLSCTPSVEFEHNLELLLAKLTIPGRTLVMFELPLLPNRIPYGQIQRRLASKYHVWLIPKRFFAAVIGGANATSDGLHLSPGGTRQMAMLVANALSPLLKSSAVLDNPDKIIGQFQFSSLSVESWLAWLCRAECPREASYRNWRAAGCGACIEVLGAHRRGF
jgi:acyl-CoA thioesterase-1